MTTRAAWPVVAVELVAVVLLHGLGRAEWTGALRLADTAPPVDLAAALVRLVALALAWWCLATTVGALVLARRGRPDAARRVLRLVPTAVRLRVEAGVAVAATTGALLAPTAAVALPAPPGVVPPRSGDVTTTVDVGTPRAPTRSPTVRTSAMPAPHGAPAPAPSATVDAPHPTRPAAPTTPIPTSPATRSSTGPTTIPERPLPGPTDAGADTSPDLVVPIGPTPAATSTPTARPAAPAAVPPPSEAPTPRPPGATAVPGAPVPPTDGWQERLPDIDAVRGSVVPGPTTDHAAEHVVRAGEHLWSIARDALAAAGLATDDLAVARHWRRLVDANRDRLGGDPDLVHPGQVVALVPVTSP